jgi:hypothetical protein
MASHFNRTTFKTAIARRLRRAVEFDGGQHAEARNEDTDCKRDQWLADHGVTVMSGIRTLLETWPVFSKRSPLRFKTCVRRKRPPPGAGAPTSPFQGEVDRVRGTVEALTSTVTVNQASMKLST